MKKTKQQFQWNKVTPFSKYLAMVLFIALPFVGFVIGMKYQSFLDNSYRTSPIVEIQSSDSLKKIDVSSWKVYANKKYYFSFKYPVEFLFKDNTGGSDFNNVPLKVSLTSPTSTIIVAIQKRQCNKSTGLPEKTIQVGGKEGVRILTEDQMDGRLFSIDTVEIQLGSDMCLTLGKHVEDVDNNASIKYDENLGRLKELTNQDKEIFNSIISTINFGK